MSLHEFAVRTVSTASGTVAVEISGEQGPLIVCAPGMGDLRSAYRHLTPILVDAGCRVAVIDLPGHGDSQLGATPSQREIARILADLALELGGPAIAVGHSYTPDSALLATQIAPEVVVGAVAIAPWAAEPAQRGVGVWLARMVGSSPRLWSMFMSSLYRQRPDDLQEHLARVRANGKRPGGMATIAAMAGGIGKDAIRARATQTAPTVVIMGARDPDFRDPRAEAESFASDFAADIAMIPGVGHYPHAEAADAVAVAILELVAKSVNA